ncbi:hypothetical protein [Robbsia sp. KACC 23696]|uniref:hypothetical protein n=1 Tax=Robbsia sp. KACC 23696 TaxID=3149231 RepID=UPI00325BAF1C
MQAASNPMTFAEFIELLPMAFGEENTLPFEQDLLSAIDKRGNAGYTTHDGLYILLRKGHPEARRVVELTSRITNVRMRAKTNTFPHLQYGMTTSRLSAGNDVSDTISIHRQVSLFDLTPARVESEIAHFCKSCFCALTMLKYNAQIDGGNEKALRISMLRGHRSLNQETHWASLAAIPSSSVQTHRTQPSETKKTVPWVKPDETLLGYIFTPNRKPPPIDVYPPSAKWLELSHCVQSESNTGSLEHVKDWRALQRTIPHFFGETLDTISHGQEFYVIEKTKALWHRTLKGIDLYFTANPCDDGDTDVAISARIKTLVTNPAGATYIARYINVYNTSPYLGTLSLDTDSTVTLWCAMNLESSQRGEVQRTLKEIAAAISDIDAKVTSMTNYFEMPYCSYIAVSKLSNPSNINRRNEPSFKECLLTALGDFGENGEFAGLSRDAIETIDIKTLSSAALRDICLNRLTRFDAVDERRDRAGHIPLLIIKTDNWINSHERKGSQALQPANPTKTGSELI